MTFDPNFISGIGNNYCELYTIVNQFVKHEQRTTKHAREVGVLGQITKMKYFYMSYREPETVVVISNIGNHCAKYKPLS